jgi:UDP-N-acetyl-D-mannosaminuronic acid dehydrogenase
MCRQLELTDAEVRCVADARTAEAVKVFEGVYRDVNIALANELATLADDLQVDTLAAMRAANTLPMCDLHRPGAGVGGHCIPVYPYFLTETVERATPLIETARSVNDGMPHFVVRRLEQGLAAADKSLEEVRVAVLGLTYRAGVNELRYAPSVPIVEMLAAAGADVVVVDPVLETFEGVPGTPVAVAELADVALDAVVIVTAHAEFTRIDWDRFDELVIVDGRDLLDAEEVPHRVYGVGW